MRLRCIRLLALILLAGCSLALFGQPICSINTVVGTWAVQGNGTLFPTPPGATSPIAVRGGDVGIAYVGYDGSITISITAITARSGGAAPQTFSGTISVSPDCTATVTTPTPIPGFTAQEQFAILDNGNEMWTIALNGLNAKPAVWQCHWRRMSLWPKPMSDWVSNCSAGVVRGNWIGRYDGVLVSSDGSAPAPFGALMMGTVNPEGELQGTFTTSLAGTVSTGTYSGSITQMNQDCTGTWTLTFMGADGTQLPGGGAEKFVVVNGGREIWTLSTQGTAGKPVGVGSWQRRSLAPYR